VSGHTCASCRFFHITWALARADFEKDASLVERGECRKVAPVGPAGWSDVWTYDWCGEFEPKEKTE
jgi:hypothetical protein